MSGVAVRVVSYNVRGCRPPSGPADPRPIAEILAAFQPALMGLQEVFRFMPPHLQDQPGRIAARLGAEYRFGPSLGVLGAGYGNAILVSGGPSLSWNPAACTLTLLPDRGERRSVLEAVISVDGRPIRFLNAHLGLARQDRAAQIRVIAASVRGSSVPVIALGDWNSRREDGEFAPLQDAGLTLCGEAPLLTFPGHAPDRDLDHILVSGHFETTAVRVEPVVCSDHFPLIADLLLRT